MNTLLRTALTVFKEILLQSGVAFAIMLAYILYFAAACHAWPSYGGLRDPGNCNPLIKDSRTHLSS